jgi:putative tricarboxylic transport membrane protein
MAGVVAVLESLLAGIELAFRLDTFVMMSVGLVLGMLIGALPGFTTVMAMAVLLPISFFLHPLVGIPFLIGVYKGGIYGGSIPAILVSMPGTGASVATLFDGPALTKKRQSRKALEIALFASCIGDFASDVLTIVLIGPIALLAMLIGPPELAAVMLLSLLVIVVTEGGVVVKGLIMLLVGLFLAMIGQDPIGALSRFTFGFFAIEAGIPLLPMLIGLFAIPEVLLAVESRATSLVGGRRAKAEGPRLSWSEFRRCLRTIGRSTVIGTGIGVIPGVGQVVAAFMGYAAAKSASSTPERFGKGELEGVAAAEAANNAVNGPTLVPLLTIGVPGDNITAILLGAFVAQGLRPGPQLFAEQADLVYGILIAMLVCNLLFLVLGYLLVPLFVKIVTIGKPYLLPITVIFAFAGTYVFRSNPMDLLFLVAFGVVGYVCRKLGFSVTPLVMGFILGPVLEYAFGQTVTLGQDNVAAYIATERPIALAILVATPLLTYLMWQRSLRLRRTVGGRS